MQGTVPHSTAALDPSQRARTRSVDRLTCRAQGRTPVRSANLQKEVEPDFIPQLRFIHRLATTIARRNRLSPEDVQDFAADVQLRVVSDNYRILERFESRCSLRTFLSIAVRRMFLDYRNAQWGKWRPSARSCHHGDVAVLMERLTVRDGYTFDEACAILETNHRLKIDREALQLIHAGVR